MRKLLSLLLAACALMVVTTACGDDDDNPINRGERTITVDVVDHVVAPDGKVAMQANQLAYTFNLTDLTGGVKLTPTLGGTQQTFNVSGLKLTSVGTNQYRLSANNMGGLTSMVGYLNFNEVSVRFTYEANGYKVVSTIPEVFSLKTRTEVAYDTIPAQTSDDVIYQFDLDPEHMSAEVEIKAFPDLERKRMLAIESLTDADVTTTKDGYDITATQLKTTATYPVNGGTAKTDSYVITDLKAHLDLYENTLTLTCGLGSYKITVTGTLSN